MGDETPVLSAQQRTLAVLKTRFEDYQFSHNNQHQALGEVLAAKEVTLKERLESMNEFREEARTVQNTYMRKDLHEQQYTLLISRIATLEGTLRGIYIGLGITVLTTVVTLVIMLFKGHP